ncbi:PhzF family phenazine biosynthesis protein [Blastopirellula retiformator]|uniref:Putative isomerase YddE n=1 Tax=Blastopirellula retiformator TaxID=2527970 RepID=A0A5C5V2W2_9BACT|nr:PhzF family phenazine biosynthesis protein [Blastopirellula retiformator]TWT32721.1 putative isomerase YddE [Blastopirellula retiformator]
MPQPLYQIDAFTSQPLSGNPAAVCWLSQPCEDSWLQQVAAEMNLSETAFLWQEESRFRLRWFTPTVEVDLCGHATLAASHFLWETGKAAPEQTIEFNTRSGVLTATKVGSRIELDFPIDEIEVCPPPAGLIAALGCKAIATGRNRRDVLVEVATKAELRSVQPDFRALAEIRVRGVMVTCRGDGERYEFLSRFFAPGSGIDEDPVTGSAHCALVTYWSPKWQKETLRAFQCSQRGGEVEVTLDGDRAKLRGAAVTVLRGELDA